MSERKVNPGTVRQTLMLAVNLLLACALLAQNTPGGQRSPSKQDTVQPDQNESSPTLDQHAEAELQTGTKLTRQGLFADAIPHLLAARGHVTNTYAADFNLALCYVGTRQTKPAIVILEALRKENHTNVDVENLLAQAYIGDGQSDPAINALRRASAFSPKNEKLYMYVADACMESHNDALGLRVLDLALTNLPESAQLHYERAVFESLSDDMDRAKEDFRAARQLQPGSDVSYLASAHEDLMDGNPDKAVRAAREGIDRGFRNPNLLTILAEALIRSGARPGEPEFAEAEKVLEEAVSARPRDAGSRTSLGRVYLLANRVPDAIAQLEVARELDPRSPAVYSSLAKAYRQNADLQRSQAALTELEKINQKEADKIASAPGDRHASYAGSMSPADHH